MRQIIIAPVVLTYMPAKRLYPSDNRIEMADGTSVAYDYLVIATGPELAFDEIEGLGPDGHTQSICHVDHAEAANAAFEAFCRRILPPEPTFPK